MKRPKIDIGIPMQYQDYQALAKYCDWQEQQIEHLKELLSRIPTGTNVDLHEEIKQALK